MDEPSSDPSDSSALLGRATDGDDAAADRLFQLVYTDLHRRAARLMAAQPAGHSLGATDLVNECFLKIAGGAARTFKDREHFIRTAARAMRHILTDHARAKGRIKRGGGFERKSLESVTLDFEEHAVSLLDLDQALTELASFDPNMAEAVELRFFGGATFEEIARALGITRRQLEGRWAATRAWLFTRVQ